LQLLQIRTKHIRHRVRTGFDLRRSLALVRIFLEMALKFLVVPSEEASRRV